MKIGKRKQLVPLFQSYKPNIPIFPFANIPTQRERSELSSIFSFSNGSAFFSEFSLNAFDQVVISDGTGFPFNRHQGRKADDIHYCPASHFIPVRNLIQEDIPVQGGYRAEPLFPQFIPFRFPGNREVDRGLEASIKGIIDIGFIVTGQNHHIGAIFDSL